MNPVFNRSGYVLDAQELRVLQKDGWVSLPLSEIADVKPASFATVLVRLADGRKKSLDLSHLSTRAFAKVSAALKQAHHHRRMAVPHARPRAALP